MSTTPKAQVNSAMACPVRPAAGVAGLTAYTTPASPGAIDLRLDGNEGVAPPAELLREMADLSPEILRRYPAARELEAQLGAYYGLPREQVIVTAGADDALDRACRATLGPKRELILPIPTFEMLERYPRLVGASVVSVPWPGGAYPTAAVRQAISERTGAIAVVTPNNPTGAVATVADLQALSAAAPQALLIVDLAYGEYAEEDLTAAVLALPNAIAVRTFSKAWGLAGLRVGYALGPAAIIALLRAVGGPYPTSGLSLLLAGRRLATGVAAMRANVAQVRRQRVELCEFLRARGVDVLPSQGNFVFARFKDASRVWNGLAATGILVRSFPGRPGLADALRITCPGEPAAMTRLMQALRELL